MEDETLAHHLLESRERMEKILEEIRQKLDYILLRLREEDPRTYYRFGRGRKSHHNRQ